MTSDFGHSQFVGGKLKMNIHINVRTCNATCMYLVTLPILTVAITSAELAK